MKRPKRWSLRSRLLAGVLTLVAAGFSCAGIASGHLLGKYLTARVDEQLIYAQERLQAFDASNVDAPVLSDRERDLLDAYVVQVRNADGTIKWEFAAPDQKLILPELPTQRDKPFYVDGERHHPGYRVIITDLDNGSGILVIAYDMSGTARTMARFVGIELVVMLTVLGLSALLGVAVVRVGLRPLTEVEQTAEEIVAGKDLSRRVPALAAPATEMGRLSGTLNSMLDEIEGNVARLRRFVSDASHELRTPVAGIRGLAELYRQGAVTDPAEVSALIARIESEATRMGVLVEDLLLLARLDEERPLRQDQVDLVPIAADAIEGHPVDLELVGDDPPVVIGDEDRLRQIVTNLVTNALSHTPPGTPVTVRVGVDKGKALLEVADRGPGIAPEHAQRVFERFYRVDPARARDHERSPATGSGLGLSIVSGLVAAHGGSVVCVPTEGGGATFRITLPLAVLS
ncbi:sensor histidine kinase [Catelliglobosispora koreensis]|uniref:sensor histidine kinase n=1 Tax=Catelliglobosispora koreensis TaxID=129052 RepID=UPI00035D2B0A|nr:HAMP domain-containing sensor histidine kinase [Catelliglobosispora koreensis]